MAEESRCEVCQKNTNKKCGRCHCAFYCCREHQRIGWKGHKKKCRPFAISESEELGRYLVATTPISEGTLILKEQPLVVGPLLISVRVCIGCYNLYNEDSNITFCEKCGWPFCSPICQTNPNHIAECFFTSQKTKQKISIDHLASHPVYKCVTVLRCLYQKQFAPEIWSKINNLESKLNDIKKSVQYEDYKRDIAEFIRNYFSLKDAFTEEEILKICGILYINAHEVSFSSPHFMAIYELACLLEHNCSANCYKTYTSKGEIQIIAGKSIEKNEHLSICYTNFRWTTLGRRRHLNSTKFLSCTCKRCLDVTEFGTNFSALKCQNEDCSGILLPDTFLEEECPWSCNKCQNIIAADDANKIIREVVSDVKTTEKTTTAYKMFLERHEKTLPKNNCVMIDVKLALSQLIGLKLGNNPGSISINNLNLKIKLNRDILEILKIIGPAEKTVIGNLLIDLHLALAEACKRRQITGDIKEIPITVMEFSKILREALDCLKYEPKETLEGKLYQKANVELDRIKNYLSCLLKRF